MDHMQMGISTGLTAQDVIAFERKMSNLEEALCWEKNKSRRLERQIETSFLLNHTRCPLNVGTDLLNRIDKVIYNDPATIIIWKDKTRTVVKKQRCDKYDAEKGLAMAFIKKVFENQGNYNDLFKKFGAEDKNK